MAKLKSFVVALVVFMALGCYGQTNTVTLTNYVNVANSTGFDANPADAAATIAAYIPAKYKALFLGVVGFLVLVGNAGRVITSVINSANGSKLKAALSSVFLGHNATAKNEIAALKDAVGLAPVPAPPAETITIPKYVYTPQAPTAGPTQQPPPTNTPLDP